MYVDDATVYPLPQNIVSQKINSSLAHKMINNVLYVGPNGF